MFLKFLGFHFQAVVWKKQLPNCTAACCVSVCKVLPSASEDRWDEKACECFLSSLPSFSFSLAGKWGCQDVLWVLDSGGQVCRRWALHWGHGWQQGKPLSPSLHTDHFCGKLWCFFAPALGCFNRLIWILGGFWNFYRFGGWSLTSAL